MSVVSTPLPSECDATDGPTSQPEESQFDNEELAFLPDNDIPVTMVLPAGRPPLSATENDSLDDALFGPEALHSAYSSSCSSSSYSSGSDPASTHSTLPSTSSTHGVNYVSGTITRAPVSASSRSAQPSSNSGGVYVPGTLARVSVSAGSRLPSSSSLPLARALLPVATTPAPSPRQPPPAAVASSSRARMPTVVASHS